MKNSIFSNILTIISIVLLISLANSLDDVNKGTYQSKSENLYGVGYYKSTEKNERFSISCALCKSTASILHGLLYYLQGFGEGVGKLACYYFTGDFSVCNGLVSELKTPFLKMFLNLLNDKEHICGLVYEYCPTTYVYEDFDAWKKDLLKDKPKFVEKKPTNKSSYTVLQVNDIHLDFMYEEDTMADAKECNTLTDCCQKGVKGLLKDERDGTTKAGFWGTPGVFCDLPQRTFKKFVSFVKDTVKPDYIIWL